MANNSVFLTAWNSNFGTPSAMISTPQGSVSASGQGVVGVGNGTVLYADSAGRGAIMTGLTPSETAYLASKHSK